MTYKEKLRDPRWQRKRLEIFERDDWKCRFCGSNGSNLQVHHVTYRRIDPWEYPDYLLQTLCENCHRTRQEITDTATDAFRVAVKDMETPRLQSACRRLIDRAMEELP